MMGVTEPIRGRAIEEYFYELPRCLCIFFYFDNISCVCDVSVRSLKKLQKYYSDCKSRVTILLQAAWVSEPDSE